MATPSESYDMLLVGKTGNGKSATGNTILRKLSFGTSANMVSSTQRPEKDVSSFENCGVNVVDSPGLNDTLFSPEDSVKRFVAAITWAIAACPEGYHAVLLVLRFGGRFTKEDRKAIGILKDVLGDQFIKYHGVIVLTCGDVFEKVVASSGTSFEDWFEDQEGDFKNLLSECGRRIVLFDNLTDDPTIKAQQIRRLLDIVKRISQDGQRYSNDLFQAAFNTRQALLVETKIKRVSDEMFREMSAIIQEVGEFDIGNPENEIARLDEIINRQRALQRKLEEEDQGTNKLDSVIDFVKALDGPFEEQRRVLKDAQELKEKTEQLNKEITSCEISKADQKKFLKRGKMKKTFKKRSIGASPNPSSERSELMASASSSIEDAEEGNGNDDNDDDDHNGQNTTPKELSMDMAAKGQHLREKLDRTTEALQKLKEDQKKKSREEQGKLERQYKDIKDKQLNSVWDKIFSKIKIPFEKFRKWWEDQWQDQHVAEESSDEDDED